MAKIETNTLTLLRRLEQEGWQNVGGAKHDKFRHATKSGTIMVPRHRTLTEGVARSIHKAAGWI